MDSDLIDVALEEEIGCGFVLTGADAESADRIGIEGGEGADADLGAIHVEALHGAVVGSDEMDPLVESDGGAGDGVPCAAGSRAGPELPCVVAGGVEDVSVGLAILVVPS